MIVGRLETWTAPSLLLLGGRGTLDVAQWGQGINVALRDALAAANHLCPVLARGNAAAVIDAVAQQAAAERMPEIVASQAGHWSFRAIKTRRTRVGALVVELGVGSRSTESRSLG